jgi:hypothetical protein
MNSAGRAGFPNNWKQQTPRDELGRQERLFFVALAEPISDRRGVLLYQDTGWR